MPLLSFRKRGGGARQGASRRRVARRRSGADEAEKNLLRDYEAGNKSTLATAGAREEKSVVSVAGGVIPFAIADILFVQ